MAATTASVALLGSNGVANATARTPSISGNGWVALGIIAFLVWAVYLLIMGALHLERRDARLGRTSRRDGGGWFGAFPARDDEDAPDFHHHDGGEGSN
jgi:hypothetical protein